MTSTSMEPNGTIWTGTFWKATAERCVRTFAQAAGAFLAADVTGLLEVDWVQGASVSGLAALLSVLTCVAAGKANPDSGPSLGTETPVAPTQPPLGDEDTVMTIRDGGDRG